MSFVFGGFGVGLTEHAQAYSRTSSILKKYLHNIIHAPYLILSLGRELDRLRLLLKQIIDENNNPNSTILRIDNKIAGNQVLQLAVTGVNATLDSCDNRLRGGKIQPGRSERWWSEFGRNMRFNGDDRGFLNLLHDLRYHCWAFEVAYRVLRDDVDSLLSTMDPTGQYLEHLLLLLTADVGGGLDDSISRQFIESAEADGDSFTSDCKLEDVMKSCLYWAFKASSDLQTANAPNPEGYLNLLKSHWIFRKFREDPRSEQMVKEFRAILAIVSTEIALSMKRLRESEVRLPDWDTLKKNGDFRILLDDPDEEVQMCNNAVHPAEYSTYHPQQSLELIDARHSSRPEGDPPHQKYPQNLGGSRLVHDENRLRGKSPGQQVTRKQLAGTGTSSNSIDSQQTPRKKWESPPRNASVSSGHLDEQRPTDSPTLGNHPPLSRSSGSPTPSSPIDSMQFGVPPLQPQRARPVGPPLPGNGFATRPLPSINTSHRPFSTTSNQVHQTGPSGAMRGGDSGYPMSPTSMYGYTGGSQANDPVDHGEGPGEIEIMRDEFRGMSLLCSDFLRPSGGWDECMVKIFRQASGDLRIVTQREGSIDQRFIVLMDAELVPEYAYHQDFPVIYVRKAGIGGYSIQSGPKARPPLNPAELCPITLYYRFKNLGDMFDFQRAFTNESVIADVQAVRTIRYKRDGEHINNRARIQLWKEQDASQFLRGDSSSEVASIAGTYRSGPATSPFLKVHSTRLVMYFNETIMTLFVTDDIVIVESKSRPRCLRIRPSSYAFLGNPLSVKACIIGNRDISGGIKLDMEGLQIRDQEGFDAFRWFEIDFQTQEEMKNFCHDFKQALQERRKERTRIAELKRMAENGVRAGQIR